MILRSFTPSTLHGLLREGSADCLLDLRRAAFFTPAAVVGVMILADASRRRGAAVRLIAPSHRDTANYLARVRLGAALSEIGVDHDLPTVHEHDHGDRLLELQRFASASELERLMTVIHRSTLRQHPRIANSLYRALGEFADSVVEHSRAQFGYMVSRVIRGSPFFAVGDSGVGFRATLARQGARDDLAALRLAMEQRVSSSAMMRGRCGFVKQPSISRWSAERYTCCPAAPGIRQRRGPAGSPRPWRSLEPLWKECSRCEDG